jgi:hypothetical protein
VPAKLDLTPEQMLARIREQSRVRASRYRERHVTPSRDAQSLSARTHEGADARSTELLVTSLPTVKRENVITGDFEQVRCVLEPVRGYVHDEQLLHRLAATCPAVDLVLEAIGMAEWLQRTANRKRVCSKAFLANWVKRAATKPTGRLEPTVPRSAPTSVLDRVLHQIATDPVAGPSTWERR